VNNWKVIFATAVIFGAGVITGGLLVNYVQHSHPKAAPHRTATAAEAHSSVTNQAPRTADAPKPRQPEVLSKQFLQRLDEELHLAPEQHEAIQKIISEGQNQMRKVIQDARLEIREVLTPEQQHGFDDLVKRPLRKPVSDTNTTFQARLNQLLVGQQRANQPSEPLSPEAQIILIEAQRAKWTNSAIPMPPIPPTPVLTNAP
jgi:uncharacterized membrane protein